MFLEIYGFEYTEAGHVHRIVIESIQLEYTSLIEGNTGQFLCRRHLLRAIFISYRREDAGGEAGRLSDDLTANFTNQSVFMDVDAIQPGRDFRRAIEESIDACSVVLAIIGQHWLDTHNSFGQRRLDDPADFVRLEIVSALKRDIPVIPVLVSGAKMPRPDQLPADLKDLSYRNAMELTHTRWKSDVQVLMQALAPYLRETNGMQVLETGRLKLSKLTPAQELEFSLTPAVIQQPDIDRVCKQLAHYIGPIAEIVVKRAAKKCASTPDLYRTVAEEIDVADDKAEFLLLSR